MGWVMVMSRRGQTGSTTTIQNLVRERVRERERQLKVLEFCILSLSLSLISIM